MPIIYNDTSIENITCNLFDPTLVTYNGEEVWSTDSLVEYTFPNSQAYLTSSGSFDFASFSGTPVSGTYANYKAFDTKTGSYFEMQYSNGEKCYIGISFPKPVLIQSITIKDSRYTHPGSSGWRSLLHTGTIYVDPTFRQTFYTTEKYADIERLPGLAALGVTDETSFKNFWSNGGVTYTTHTNPEYADPAKGHWVRSLCIHGTAWGGSGAGQGYRTISEISVTYKMKKSDFKEWEDTFKGRFHS